MSDLKPPIAIDLFCGVGGMSLGFEQAGFQVAGAFDVEARHIETYRKNFPQSLAFVQDLATATGDLIRRITRINRRKIDVLFGGPPCQGFSVGGKRHSNDPRNALLGQFARIVDELRPCYFVLENVAGLRFSHARRSLDAFLHELDSAGYRVVEPIQTLDAADYGVPQRRCRTFIIGYRNGLIKPSYPEPCGLTTFDGRVHDPTVRDAIEDLPRVDRFARLYEHDEIGPASGPASCYAKILRGDEADPNDLSPYRSRKPSVLTGCLRTRHCEQTISRFRRTLPGASERVSRYIRLDLDDVAPTIRAGTGNEHGSHTAPRPIHPTQPRCITVREGARLHSFPDWFQFHPTRWHAFRQIGNSVPPRLARAVAAKLRKIL